MPGTPPRASPCRRPGPAPAPGARRQSRTRAAGGFTLVELLLAAVIVAILLVPAVPAYHEYREGARGAWRKDKNIVPINTDFDVFSMGKDGESVPPLTARASRDDIVRANNGRYIGLASDYDP